jgi:hypothetical protein
MRSREPAFYSGREPALYVGKDTPMRSRILVQVAAGALISLLAWPAQQAYAQKCTVASARRIKKLNFDALDENDRWELAKARQKLEDAKLVAQSRKCLTHPELAVTYVLLGVVEQRSRNPAAMKAAWEKALAINPKAELPKRVRSSKMLRLFAAVKASYKPAVRVRPRVGSGVSKGPPKGFEHEPILNWEEGKTLTISVRAADKMAIQRVSLFYKTETDATPKRVEMIKKGIDKWSWSVVLEGSKIRGKELKYYLVAYATGDKEVAASGNSANMHIIQLTSAAVVRRRAGEENPLTGGVLRRRIRRQVAARLDHPLEDPDDPVRQATTPKTTVKKTRRVGPGFEVKSHLFASLSAGTGIGLMNGRTEVTEEIVPGSPSLGAVFTQIELGFLISKQFSINFCFRLGFMLVSDEVKDPEADGYTKPGCPTGATDCAAKPERNSNDYVGLLRVRWQSGRLLRADLPINLRWYVGGGMGYGIIRHLVNGRLGDPATPGATKSVLDTDKSVGIVPNAFAGISMCVLRSCAVNVHFEVNYLAAFWIDPDLNTPFHLDFSLGVNFAF